VNALLESTERLGFLGDGSLYPYSLAKYLLEMVGIEGIVESWWQRKVVK
jgi:hypothetical protein